MFTVEQQMNDLSRNNNSNNNHDNNSNNNRDNNSSNSNNQTASGSNGSSPNMQYEGRLSLQDEASLHMGEGLDLPVFTERSIITIQPGVQDESRAPMPVSTVGWQTTNASHFVPLSGLDFLNGAENLIIQQTVELSDLLATVESENRYLVKVPRGETLYLATETSSDCQRACCGSSRGFEIKMYDHTRQLAIVLGRELACNICWFGCCLQELKVYAAQGQLIGRILQQWTLLIPTFLLIDGAGNARFKIEGPAYLLCNMKKGSEFKILSRDGMIQEGTIKHVWDPDLCTYNVLVDFPQGEIGSEIKALILGAGFLLEYMFFQTNKRRTCRCCV